MRCLSAGIQRMRFLQASYDFRRHRQVSGQPMADHPSARDITRCIATDRQMASGSLMTMVYANC